MIAESNSTPCTLAASSRRRSCSSTCSIFRAIMPRTDSGRSSGTSARRARRSRCRPADDPASVAQVAQEIDHEERAALRLRVDRSAAKPRGKAMAGKLERRDSARRRPARETRAPISSNSTARLQVAADRQERMVAPAPCPPDGSWSAPAPACRRSGRPGSSGCRPSRCRPSADRR